MRYSIILCVQVREGVTVEIRQCNAVIAASPLKKHASDGEETDDVETQLVNTPWMRRPTRRKEILTVFNCTRKVLHCVHVS